MFKTYILYSSKIDQYYIGSTGNLSDRLSRHNGGRSSATKKGAPDWIVVYTDSFETRSEAVQREMYLNFHHKHG
jgi:putative endonuclease